ncbi:RsmE family RNA methyltransferase [Terriglobus tenax]|uniref:RsmE family RNA methyltransferase n=1 Tax=Terriglobus tenax TaxID=1111115 RepID=UPI0021E0F613|nr:RsmE family RNA methyltransferase [Terriglobus tenax]
MTRRRWIADTWNDERTSASLLGEQAQHLARVLRAEVGQTFDVVAGGFLHRATVASVNENEVQFDLHEEQEIDHALPVHLLMAVFKFDRMEWAIEKATELGVERITPVLARRTEKHLTQAAAKRVERWRRIALEASKQSRRVAVPEIVDPMPLKAALAGETSTAKILLSETEQETTIASIIRKEEPTALAIGPEGGWTPEEMALFTQNSWTPVTIGPRILRAETAAIAALAIAGALL